jgi:catechol 2,3-dioxygenase-like lactoylglutathione lyase family enzyme
VIEEARHIWGKTVMIGVKRIDHINMRVKNLAESIEFYRKNFGFELKEDRRDEAEPWVIIGVPGVAYLCMYEHPEKTKPDDALTINHFGLVLQDFDKALEMLRANGVEILYGQAVQWPQSRSIYIKDPNGYEIELAEKVGGGLN